MNGHSCYSIQPFVSRSPRKGLFDDCVDATVVITMPNSTRRHQFISQLHKFKPSSKIFILTNVGFKQCDKDTSTICHNRQTKVNQTNVDLIHAYRYMLNWCQMQGFTNVLGLEDDFEFMDIVLSEPIHCKRVCQFVNTAHPNIYSLGLTYVFSPSIFAYHKRIHKIHGTHSTIINVAQVNKVFTSTKMNSLCTDIPKHHIDVDVITIPSNKWFYYRPLCTQKVDDTDNKKLWTNPILDAFINLTGIDMYQRGWNTLYGIQYLFQLIVMLLIAYVVWRQIGWCNIKHRAKRTSVSKKPKRSGK